MKLHKEIISKYSPVYDVDIAEKLYKDGKYKHRKLSLMKQENIRFAIWDCASVASLTSVITDVCGYCLRFTNVSGSQECLNCTLGKRLLIACCKLSEYTTMKNADTVEEFAKAHKKWCKKLGLWQKSWK